MEHIPTTVNLFQEISKKVTDVMDHIKSLGKKIEDGEFKTEKGVSFLEMKYQLLLSYLVNLTHLMLNKVQGKSITDSDSAEDIERLIEIRTVLEKIRPINQKLKYQIDKLMKTAATGQTNQNDPLQFRANPQNFGNQTDANESDGSGEDGEEKDKVYRPPKLTAMHYDGDETAKEIADKRLEKAKKKALSSGIIQELKDEYDEGPKEIFETRGLQKRKTEKAEKEREEYEEKYFVRMNVTKKEKASLRKLTTVNSLASVTNFGDISALTGEHHEPEEDRPRKKRKLSKAKTKKMKKRAIRRKH